MSNTDLIRELRSIVGRRQVLTARRRTEHFRTGFRAGQGEAIAVVLPRRLLELWRVLQACVAADKIVIMQAANTGLTAGSTPNGTYDRDVVMINTRAMDKLLPIDGGRQIVSFPGATLFALERLLRPLNRVPHSVIGSSCIGASIVGGVCNNSGGSLVERGPSYTELSLFARVASDGRLELVNHLGISLGSSPEEILTRLEEGAFTPDDVETTNKKGSDTDYGRRVRDVDAPTPARFNADKRCLYEASGCAGRLAVFAVRLDTYAINEQERTFYIGTNDPDRLTEIRRHILSRFDTLPVSAEYMHRASFDMARQYGKDTVLMIRYLGTDRLPLFFAMKGSLDAWLNAIPYFPRNLVDRTMQRLSRLWPEILPREMLDYRDRYEHHLILKMHDDGIVEARHHLAAFFADSEDGFFECTDRQAKLAELHRFAAAGAAVRYQAVHGDQVEDILALDIALKRNDRNWCEDLPPEIDDHIMHKLYYGHFMCHVLHQDYILRKGVDVGALKKKMLAQLDRRGAEYPAEHNVGHIYAAKPDLADFYERLDPTNSFNPGIGKTARDRRRVG